MKWREIGGPVVVSRSKRNYGMNVVRELIPYEPAALTATGRIVKTGNGGYRPVGA